MAEVMTVDDARGWNPDAEWVAMKHPKIDAPPAIVTRESFDEVHSQKGWVLVEGEGEPESGPRRSRPNQQASEPKEA